MRKFLFSLTSICLLASIGLAAYAWENFQKVTPAPKNPAQAAQQASPTFITYMAWDPDWNQSDPDYGFYEITGPSTKKLMLKQSSPTIEQDPLAYLDGKVYYLRSTVLKSFNDTYSTSIEAYDAFSFEKLSTKAAADNGNVYGYDMTIDYTDMSAYAIACSNHSSGKANNMMNYNSVLNKVDLAEGTGQRIGEQANLHLVNIAADASGELWAMGFERDATNKILHDETYLFKLNKTTGAATKIVKIEKELTNNLRSSLVFDFRDGKLYLAGSLNYYYYVSSEKRTGHESGVWEVNTSTGELIEVISPRITMVGESSPKFAGLMIRASHPKAPAELADLNLADSKVTFTVPNKAYDGTAISGPLTGEMTVDGGTPVALTNLACGSAYTSANLGLQNGRHTVKVILYNGSYKSVPNVIDLFMGTDPTPSAVSDITLNQTADAVVKVAWTAPTIGANGGAIESAKLRYKVVRLPDEKVLEEACSGTAITDNIDRAMGYTGYRIIPSIDGVEGASATSGSVVAGLPHALPYLEDFQSQAGWLSYTTIDANNDYDDYDGGGIWWWGYQAFGTGTACYYSNVSPADDYLITPALELKNDRMYKLQFQTFGRTSGYINKLQVLAGTTPTVEGMSRELMDIDYLTVANVPFTYSKIFRPASGELRIGFRNHSQVSNNPWGQSHMDIDNIYVIDYGPITIPGECTGLTGTFDIPHNRIDLSMTAPTKTAEGKDLSEITSVKIYRNGKSAPVGTITDVTPGKALTFTDNAPVAGTNAYVIVAENADGAGLEAAIEVSGLADVPKAPTALTVTPQSAYTVAQLSWTQDYEGVNGGQLTSFDISYEIYRMIGVYRTQIESNWVGTEYVDRDIINALAERDINGQGYVSYEIVPRTSGGVGEKAESSQFLAGRSYPVPFKESWPSQGAQRGPWLTDGTIYPVANGYNPRASASDSDYGFIQFEGSAALESARIDVSGVINPWVDFYVYHHAGTEAQGASLLVYAFNAANPAPVSMLEVQVNDGSEGWKKHTANFPASLGACDDLRVGFLSKGSSGNYVYLDQVDINGEQPEYEVKVEAIVAPANILIGAANTISVDVRNLGYKSNKNIEVALTVADETVGTLTIDKMDASSTKRVDFEFTPSLRHTEGLYGAQAVITAEKDGSEANNVLDATVSLVAPMLPFVNDLTGDGFDGEGAWLKWSEATTYPHQEYAEENVDGLEAFAIQDMGGWTTIDVDGAKTAQITLTGAAEDALEWKNAGEPQAYIVFNTDEAGTSTIIQPRSGSQCFISFESVSGNDDWLISPQLSGDAQTISFYAKCLYPLLLEEKFEVYVSKTRKDGVDDFTECLTAEPVVVNSATDWTRYSYDLPEGSRYFAIRCVSLHQFGLMIDDIAYSPAHAPLDFYGYNVYRDGQKITDEEIGEGEYTDNDVTTGQTYEYNVTAVYATGESIFSNTVSLTAGVSGITDAIAGKGDIAIGSMRGAISVSGASGQQVIVASLSGQIVYNVSAQADQLLLPAAPGIYLVKAGARTAKVAVK